MKRALFYLLRSVPWNYLRLTWEVPLGMEISFVSSYGIALKDWNSMLKKRE